jgi:hypothetical protein
MPYELVILQVLIELVDMVGLVSGNRACRVISVFLRCFCYMVVPFIKVTSMLRNVLKDYKNISFRTPFKEWIMVSSY